MSTKTSQRGFTLIELLVVIAIIGILASVVLASLNTARNKGADAAIKANVSGLRAQAEIIYDSADATKIYMGLTNWKQAPDGKILKSDVSIAKNYLNKAHIEELNRIISAYLDLAENRAKRQIATTMEEWVKFLHSFLELSNYKILTDKGKVSMLEAKLKAEKEFEQFRIIQDQNYISDFDKEIKRILGEEKK